MYRESEQRTGARHAVADVARVADARTARAGGMRAARARRRRLPARRPQHNQKFRASDVVCQTRTAPTADARVQPRQKKKHVRGAQAEVGGVADTGAGERDSVERRRVNGRARAAIALEAERELAAVELNVGVHDVKRGGGRE